jgi:hypothetical protein
MTVGLRHLLVRKSSPFDAAHSALLRIRPSANPTTKHLFLLIVYIYSDNIQISNGIVCLVVGLHLRTNR